MITVYLSGTKADILHAKIAKLNRKVLSGSIALISEGSYLFPGYRQLTVPCSNLAARSGIPIKESMLIAVLTIVLNQVY
jgi:hypothetical protein